MFSRFDKLDVMFAAFVRFALIVDALRLSVNTPQSSSFAFLCEILCVHCVKEALIKSIHHPELQQNA